MMVDAEAPMIAPVEIVGTLIDVEYHRDGPRDPPPGMFAQGDLIAEIGSGTVTVGWSGKDSGGETESVMRQWFEAYLHALMIRDRALVWVEWEIVRRLLSDGTPTTELVNIKTSTELVGPRPKALPAYRREIQAIRSRPEIAHASDRCRTAFLLEPIDKRASMCLSYLAVEGLVFDLTGDDTQPWWAPAAVEIGFDPAVAVRLYASTQFARHDRQSERTREIAGENPLEAWTCAFFAWEFASKYLEWALRQADLVGAS